MANLTNKDIPKHDYMYVTAVIEDLRDKLSKEYVLKVLNLVKTENTSELVEVLKEIQWTKIDKSKYSGKGKSRTPPVTDESEQAVIMFLELFVSGVLKEDTYQPIFLQYFNKYKFEQCILTSADIETTLSFLGSKPDWAIACFSSAYMIYNHFGNKLKSYTFHQNSTEFNFIRKLGASLSKLKADKWNPADVILIKKSFNVNSLSSLTLNGLNSFLEEHNEVIGISLKKSQKEANHGKSTLSLTKFKGIKPSKIQVMKGKEISESGKGILTSLMKEIHKKFDKSLLYYREYEGPILKQIESAKPKSSNYPISIPVILDWIAKHKDQEDLNDSLCILAYNCLSLNVLSCGHYKCFGSDKKIVEVGKRDPITIERIRFKLQGDIDVLVDIQVGNKKYKAQIRSFGSIPQMELKDPDKGIWQKLKL